MNLCSRAIAPAALVGLGLVLVLGASAQQPQPVPDAPTPQAPTSLPGGPVTPGIGGGDTSSSSANSSSVPAQPPAEPATVPQPPASRPPVALPPSDQQPVPPEEGADAQARIKVQVNFVEVPVTVKDAKGNPVSGLTWRDFTVYENNVRQNLRLFSVDAVPLSVAFVIDQTLPSNYMAEVNQSMGAIQGAMTPYDEAAVFTYTHFTKEWTGFTGGQSSRLPAVLALAQSTGTDPTVPIVDGPLAGCNIRQNGSCVSPVLQQGGSTGNDTFIKLPKEVHALNDAILQAAKELSTRPKERRRIIYVVSDGKEYGSKATWQEVRRYLQTNNITVYATLVGASAQWGQEWLDRFHLPFEMYDNILYKYTSATGGDMFAERGTNSMEKSYAKLAGEARNQYTLGYLSHESIYDGKYRSINVVVNRPQKEVVVTAKPGYYPSAQEYK